MRVSVEDREPSHDPSGVAAEACDWFRRSCAGRGELGLVHHLDLLRSQVGTKHDVVSMAFGENRDGL